ncbi:MAG TPA: cellulase family glycosylhydrolase [Candidatus Saccharimonadales bacterium]|jgi:mannan endo-1,4-beta-mannosidase
MNKRRIISGLLAIAVVASVVSIGVYLNRFSQAATPFVSTQPETGTLTGNSSIVSDTTASGTKALKFGAVKNFYIVGSDIVDPDGKIMYPVGSNLGIRNAFDWKGVATGHAAEAAAWGWNIVRINYACTNRVTYNTRYRDGYAALLKQVDDVVREYTARKIVVMLECHDPYAQIWSTPEQQNTVILQPGSAGINAGNQSDVGKTYRQQMEEYWRDTADRYKSNPYVWFNFFNEPFGNDNAAFITLNNHFYNLVRTRGAENIAVADIMNSGNDAAANGALHIYDPSMGPKLAAGKCNQMFGLHAYGWNNNLTTYTKLFDQMKLLKLSLIVGEFGYRYDVAPTDSTYMMNKQAADAMFALGPKYGFGLIQWSGTHGDNYSLKNDGSAFYGGGGPGLNLSPLGTAMWNAGHNKPVQRTFTGSLADSLCSSARL